MEKIFGEVCASKVLESKPLKCNKCGFGFLSNPYKLSQICPECLDNFLKQNCGIGIEKETSNEILS